MGIRVWAERPGMLRGGECGCTLERSVDLSLSCLGKTTLLYPHLYPSLLACPEPSRRGESRCLQWPSPSLPSIQGPGGCICFQMTPTYWHPHH